MDGSLKDFPKGKIHLWRKVDFAGEALPAPTNILTGSGKYDCPERASG